MPRGRRGALPDVSPNSLVAGARKLVGGAGLRACSSTRSIKHFEICWSGLNVPIQEESMPDGSALSPSDVSGKLDMLVELLRDAERLAKELDGARIGDWYRRPDLTADAAASMESRAQDVSLVAHEIGRRLDVVSHQLLTIRPPRRLPS